MKKLTTSVQILLFISLLMSCLPINALERTITITNRCPFTVVWGLTGSPIKNTLPGETVANVVTCKKPGELCFDKKGICADNKLCYFNYPTLTNGDPLTKNDITLTTNDSRQYRIELIDRHDPNPKDSKKPKLVTQYTFNIGPQTHCSLDKKTDIYQCLSAACTRHPKGALKGLCELDKGLQSPYTQAELTFNNKANDFYDLSVINGINVPISITPTGTFGKQGMQSAFFCTNPGAAPSDEKNNLKGCRWRFSPPTSKPFVFTQIDRDLAKKGKSCENDNHCGKNERCGLKYPEDLKSFFATGYCGTPLGLYTVTDICSLGGVSHALQILFKCADDDKTKLGNGVEVLNTALYQCKTEGKLLDSCYNYLNDKNSKNFCCGCIDWPDIPTDDHYHCISPSNAHSVKSTAIFKIYANPDWLDLVKPKLEWLIDGCPDAYEYQYGDKHGTVQCSSKDKAITSGNDINYTITFCPGGVTVF